MTFQARFLAVAVALFTLIAVPAFAGTRSFVVNIDTDNNASTGCQVPTVNGLAAGIEQVLTTVISTTATTVTVARVEMQVCSGGNLSAPSIINNGGWSVGLGLGTSRLAVIETAVPLSSLKPNNGKLRNRLPQKNIRPLRWQQHE